MASRVSRVALPMWGSSTTFGKWSTPGPVFAYIAEKIVAFVGQVGDGLCRLPGSHRAIAKLPLKPLKQVVKH